MTIFAKMLRSAVRETSSFFARYAEGVAALREFTAMLGTEGDVCALATRLQEEDANPSSKLVSGVHSLRWVLFQPELDRDDSVDASVGARFVLVLSFVFDGDVGDALDELCELRATRDILSFCSDFDPDDPVQYLKARRVESGYMFRDLGPLRGTEGSAQELREFDATRSEIEDAFGVQSRFESFYAAHAPSGASRPLRQHFLEEFAKEAFPFALTPFERVLPDEPRTIRRMSEVIRRMQARVARRPKAGRPGRGAHTKGHGLLRGTLRVSSDVPSQFAKGLFAAKGETFDVLARPSNGAPRVQSDRQRDERGLALTVELPLNGRGGFEPGDFLFPGQQEGTGRQDFVLNSEPEFFAANIREAVTIFSILASTSPWEAIARAAAFVIGNGAFRQVFLLVRGVGAAAVPHPLLPTFHSATPYLLGDDYVVKYSAELVHGEQLSRFKVGKDGSFLRRALRDGLGREPIELHLFLHAVSKTQWPLETIVNAVEDATTDFSALNPLKVRVATVRFERQDPATSANVREAERRSFSPWNSLKVHRPIGSINRGRLFIYKNSAHFRTEAARSHLHPVASSETLPEPGSQAAE